ncbi:YcgN family cysteine cluster protein [Pseudohongiella sp. SYSU M77423]|uniref:YcgN family cysteine cluster protein n=1 Tax=Pseudohongiella sp. SYSU M77423 TaxID=3042312 RepID=UPI00247FAA53|nr:YcgN family cysteine cluster protein [Pseudohongiella sp. SYSU M77423]MDH7943179.1 YcgN family cysteine cluster protein [Pseudohongiella sp. SYSU M77423]
MTDNKDVPFWERPLETLNRAEWEALCDGCARCCQKKLQDEDGELWYTRVVCRLLDQQACSCTAYGNRQVLVPDCLVLDMDVLAKSLDWIPGTCAYKLRYQGKPLPSWHPLLTGSSEAMLEQGIKVTGRVLSEEYVHEDGLEEHVIRWVTP